MWDWLENGGTYSSGAAYPLVAIIVFLFAVSMVFWGLTIIKTRAARVHVGTGELKVLGKRALVLGAVMCTVGCAAFVALLSLLLQ